MATKAARVGVYARVSTLDQTTDNQLLDLRRYCQERGWTITDEFVDEGISGTVASSPSLDRLMDAARKRQVDIVLVWRFDRFARSVRHLVAALDEFRALGVAFVAQNDAIDTTTPTGKLTYHVLAALSEFERSLIQERILSGLSRARAQGKRLGRPPVAVDADQVRALRRKGLSLRAIGREMAISKDAAARALSQNPC